MNRIKKSIKKYWPILLSFIIPFVIMACYFAYRNMFPFGNNSISTVDLGQQYIDLFSYYRNAILNHPSSIIYSFSNGLGGGMIGNWAYYLMSPLNLILLLFKAKFINAAILLITLLKYGLSGMCFSILLLDNKSIKKIFIPAWATIYALNGWIIANQLNIIWLDGMIFLPLIIMGMRKLFFKQQIKLYIISLTAMLIINYYIAYMIIIFVGIYFVFVNVIYNHKWKDWIHHIKNFLFCSLISLGLSAWLLIPTFYDLLQGKAQYSLHTVNLKFEYLPIKMIAKFFNGTFNFNQMPSGTPNIFIGAIPIIYFLALFFNHEIKLKIKISIFIVTVFLLLSMCFEPLDLIWHAMQFPVWYPYRFSFIFCFWIIFIASQSTPKFQINNWKTKLNILLILILAVLYVSFNLKQFSFLTINNLITSIIFLTISYILIMFIPSSFKTFQVAFIIIIIAEMGINAFNSLNNISYIPNNSYMKYTTNLKDNTKVIQNHDHKWYRIGKTFFRSKDDPLNANYNGGDNFSSTINYRSTQFMDNIGQPTGEGYIEYSNGTLLSDSLLSFKYFLKDNGNPVLSNFTPRPDFKQYSYYNENHQTITFKNSHWLPIGFAANSKIFNLKHHSNDLPTVYQSNIMNYLTNHQNQRFFDPKNFDQVTFNNTNKQTRLTNALISKNNLIKPAIINLTFTPKTNDPYYLTLGNAFNDKSIKLSINGSQIIKPANYQNTTIINVATNNKNKPIHIHLKLIKDNMFLQNFILYHFNSKLFQNDTSNLKQNQFKIHNNSNRKFIGTIRTTKSKNSLITTIPYSKGWHLIVDNKPHSISKWSNMFIGSKLSPGKHSIKLYYWPPYLTLGICISILTVIFMMVINKIKKYNKKA
ncbi:YfhO family protein [Philodulcilactobacillus myokoensis]|uniref:YfhO family protein n=1 Tax=Philodulcilactobacillus myokoensis TaxID=2929573 RepID=UPI0025709E2B|nr:YfhO family protein [Philodulcilactobacillus myokoensis]